MNSCIPRPREFTSCKKGAAPRQCEIPAAQRPTHIPHDLRSESQTSKHNGTRCKARAVIQTETYAGMVLGDFDQAESHKDNGDFYMTLPRDEQRSLHTAFSMKRHRHDPPPFTHSLCECNVPDTKNCEGGRVHWTNGEERPETTSDQGMRPCPHSRRSKT